MSTKLTNIAESGRNLMIRALEPGPMWKGLPRFETFLLRTHFYIFQKKQKNEKLANIIRFPPYARSVSSTKSTGSELGTCSDYERFAASCDLVAFSTFCFLYENNEKRKSRKYN